MNRLYIILLALLGIACEDTVDIPLPEHTSRLVFFSATQPGDSLRLHLTRSYGPLERVTVSDLLIDDAEVTFSLNGVAQGNVLYRDTSFNSQFSLGDSSSYYLSLGEVAEAGDRITIEVSHPDFETARGETVVAQAGSVVKSELIQNAFRSVFSADDAYTQSILRLTFSNPNDAAAFYRINRAFFSFTDPTAPNQVQFGVMTILGPAVPASDGGFETPELYAEQPSPGEITIDFLCELPNAFAPVDQWVEVEPDSLWIETEFANADYAQYLEKLQTQQQSVGGINLTPAEPVELFSNVEGGFGVVGSFTVKTDSLVFTE